MRVLQIGLVSSCLEVVAGGVFWLVVGSCCVGLVCSCWLLTSLLLFGLNALSFLSVGNWC